MRSLFLYVALLYSFTLYSNSSSEIVVRSYIDNFKDEAITEMIRTGIPASIKLAQGILESDAGRSELAREANNHFGMKCGSSWEGFTYYKKDDDRDRRGRLIKSCFRVYNSALESYKAHSLFLMDPKKEYRYGFLFDIDKTDYRSWAWGLQQSGYATNKRYAVLLIDIIERYGLFTYDYQKPSGVYYVEPGKTIAENRSTDNYENINTLKIKNEEIIRSTTEKFNSAKRKIVINDVEAIVAREGETIEEIAKNYDLKPKSLLKYNERVRSSHDKLYSGDKVFLKKKKRDFKGGSHFHVVREGEDLFSISQNYGLQYKALLNRNHLEEGMEPLVGQRIKIKGKPIDLDRIPLTSTKKMERKHTQTSEKKDKKLDENVSKEEKIIENQVDKVDQSTEANSDLLEEGTFEEELSVEKTYHLVKKGDTLYSISKQYGLSVEQLKSLNQLKDNSLSIDQELLIK